MALSALSELRAELEVQGWAIFEGSHWYQNGAQRPLRPS